MPERFNARSEHLGRTVAITTRGHHESLIERQSLRLASNVQIANVQRVLFDKLATRFDLVAHQ
jgi:hypothetical protein